MAKLEKEQQEFIIECFARYLPPREIISLVKDNFAITLTQQDVYHYNPNKKNALSKELKQYFLECREEYNKNLQNIGGASKSFRVEQLTELYFTAKKNGNYKLALEVLKQLEEMDKSQEGSGQLHVNTAIKELITAYVATKQDPSHSKANSNNEQENDTNI
jgi:hypothetical protein